MRDEPEYFSNIGKTVTIEIPEEDLEYLKVIYDQFPRYGNRMGFGNFLFECAKSYLIRRIYEDGPNHLLAQLRMIDLGLNPFSSNEELKAATGYPGAIKPKPGLFAAKMNPNIWSGHPLVESSFKGYRLRWEKI